MEHHDRRWEEVVEAAQGYLDRFRDPMTRSMRDEIAQESAVLAWQWIRQLEDHRRLGAAVRTITRRQRLRALRQCRRAGSSRLMSLGEAADSVPASRGEDQVALRIASRSVPSAWVVSRLDAVLARLPALDQRLLRGFHEGFCCAELAARFERSEACIKTRLHRARRRLQRLLEELVRASDEFGDQDREEDQRP